MVGAAPVKEAAIPLSNLPSPDDSPLLKPKLVGDRNESLLLPLEKVLHANAFVGWERRRRGRR